MTLATVAALFAMVSCSKDYISPEELFGDETKVATIKIHTRSDEFQDTETTFKRVSAYRKSDLEGQSWFSAMSGGKMVYDAFMFSLYFDDIDRMKVGDVLKPAFGSDSFSPATAVLIPIHMEARSRSRTGATTMSSSVSTKSPSTARTGDM